MIKQLSDKTASYIVRNDETADFEILSYGFELIYQEVAVVVLSLLIALPFGLMLHVALGTVVFHLLRRYAGGCHAGHRLVCTVVSTLILYGPSFLFVKTPLQVAPVAYVLLFLANSLLLLRYAPADTVIRPIQSKGKRTTLKAKSLAVLTVLFLIIYFIRAVSPEFAGIIAATATIVCVFTHPAIYRILGCKKSTA